MLTGAQGGPQAVCTHLTGGTFTRPRVQPADGPQKLPAVQGDRGSETRQDKEPQGWASHEGEPQETWRPGASGHGKALRWAPATETWLCAAHAPSPHGTRHLASAWKFPCNPPPPRYYFRLDCQEAQQGANAQWPSVLPHPAPPHPGNPFRQACPPRASAPAASFSWKALASVTWLQGALARLPPAHPSRLLPQAPGQPPIPSSWGSHHPCSAVSPCVHSYPASWTTASS